MCGFFSLLFWLPLPVPIVQRTLHHCKNDLSWVVQRFLDELAVFCFFHITKLQFYSHMFKFRFLFLNPLKSNSTSSYLLYPSSLKASKLLFSPSILSALLWLEVQVWGDYKRRINIHLAFLILSASTLFSLTLLYTFCLKKKNRQS